MEIAMFIYDQSADMPGMDDRWFDAMLTHDLEYWVRGVDTICFLPMLMMC